ETSQKPEEVFSRFYQNAKSTIKSKNNNAYCLSYDENDLDRASLIIPMNPESAPKSIEESYSYRGIVPHSCYDQQTSKQTLYDQIHYLVFDHEAAHAVAPFELRDSKLKMKQVNESIADVYSALRHVKRYGHDTGIIDMLKHARVTGAAAGDFNHYTVPALEAAESYLQTTDISKKSPADLLSAAISISKEASAKFDISALRAEIDFIDPNDPDMLLNDLCIVNFMMGRKGQETDNKDVFNFCQQWFDAMHGYNRPTDNQEESLLKNPHFSAAPPKINIPQMAAKTAAPFQKR
ncbi:MAG: hypothetical protein ACQEQL_07970, partial [Pseudomonadota bacterium]